MANLFCVVYYHQEFQKEFNIVKGLVNTSTLTEHICFKYLISYEFLEVRYLASKPAEKIKDLDPEGGQMSRIFRLMPLIQKIIVCIICVCKIFISLILTRTGPVKNADGEVTILMHRTIIPDLTVVAEFSSRKNYY